MSFTISSGSGSSATASNSAFTLPSSQLSKATLSGFVVVFSVLRDAVSGSLAFSLDGVINVHFRFLTVRDAAAEREQAPRSIARLAESSSLQSPSARPSAARPR